MSCTTRKSAVPAMYIIISLHFIVDCSDPSPVAGIVFSPFLETIDGANISFNCEPGLGEDVSVCSSNGSWVPNPAHRICSPPPSSEGTTRAVSLENCCDYGTTVNS